MPGDTLKGFRRCVSGCRQGRCAGVRFGQKHVERRSSAALPCKKEFFADETVCRPESARLLPDRHGFTLPFFVCQEQGLNIYMNL